MCIKKGGGGGGEDEKRNELHGAEYSPYVNKSSTSQKITSSL